VRAAAHFARRWLQTPRLTLRPLRQDDLEQPSAWLGDADALVNWGPPLDRRGRPRLERIVSMVAEDNVASRRVARSSP
jgi:RimJ/RimL family protein N-acetyltransferase